MPSLEEKCSPLDIYGCIICISLVLDQTTLNAFVKERCMRIWVKFNVICTNFLLDL